MYTSPHRQNDRCSQIVPLWLFNPVISLYLYLIWSPSLHLVSCHCSFFPIFIKELDPCRCSSVLPQNLISLVLDLVNESLIPSASGLFNHEEKLLHKSFKMFTCYSNCVSINEFPGNSGPLSEAVRDGLLSSVPATSEPPVNKDAKDGPLCMCKCSFQVSKVGLHQVHLL